MKNKINEEKLIKYLEKIKKIKSILLLEAEERNDTKNENYYLGQWTILEVILADLKEGVFNE